MGRSWTHRATVAVAALTTLTGLAVSAADTAGAVTATASVTAPGTILYDKGGNIWESTPNGSTRIQTIHQSGHVYVQGFLWIMDRSGQVIRKFKPPQLNLLTNPSCNPTATQLPQGLINAVVSPDGKHIAYTETTLDQSPCGNSFPGFSSFVANIDGSNAYFLDDGTTNGSGDLEIGGWTDSAHILFDRPDFGDTRTFIASGTHWDTTTWMTSPDATDQAYQQPVIKGGKLVTDGYVGNVDHQVLRIWSASAAGAKPTFRCDLEAIAAGIHEYVSRPGLSPDGAYVAFEDDDGTPNSSNEGIYLAPTTCAAHQSLFIPGAADPFWTPAGLHDEPTISFTAPTSAATLAAKATFAWKAVDHGTGIGHFQYRKQSAPYNGGFGAWSATTTTSATSLAWTGLRRGSDYCVSVRAIDPHGTAGPWATRCIAVALDDRSLSASSGWRRTTGSSYFAGTVTRSSRLNATLKRSGAQLARVGLVATTCASCGKVGLYVGSTRVGVVDLHSAATHNRVLKLLPTFRLRSGTVTVKVLTSGKPVLVDGLVISRT